MVVNLGLGSMNIPSRQGEVKANRYRNRSSNISTLPGGQNSDTNNESIFKENPRKKVVAL